MVFIDLEGWSGRLALDAEVEEELKGRPLFMVFEIIQKAQRTLIIHLSYAAYLLSPFTS